MPIKSSSRFSSQDSDADDSKDQHEPSEHGNRRQIRLWLFQLDASRDLLRRVQSSKTFGVGRQRQPLLALVFVPVRQVFVSREQERRIVVTFQILRQLA